MVKAMNQYELKEIARSAARYAAEIILRHPKWRDLVSVVHSVLGNEAWAQRLKAEAARLVPSEARLSPVETAGFVAFFFDFLGALLGVSPSVPVSGREGFEKFAVENWEGFNLLLDVVGFVFKVFLMTYTVS